MPSWSDLSVESLRSAQTLRTAGLLRGSVNRAYYAAYAATTGRLIADGVQVGAGGRPNPSHAQIAALARHNLRGSEGVRKEVSRRLRTLRRFRAVADYEPRELIPKYTAIQCVRDAARSCEELRG